MVDISHMWLLGTWNVKSETEDVNFYFLDDFKWVNLIILNVNSQMWLGAVIGDSETPGQMMVLSTMIPSQEQIAMPTRQGILKI